MATTYTLSQIEDINQTRKAVPGKVYEATDGQQFVGVAGGWLIKKQTAKEVYFKPSSEITADNLQEALESIGVKVANKVKQVMIDFGTDAYLKQKIFTINDSDVKTDSKIIAQLAYTATGNRSIDELEMTEISFKCGSGDGSFLMLATSLGASLNGTYYVNYTIS